MEEFTVVGRSWGLKLSQCGQRRSTVYVFMVQDEEEKRNCSVLLDQTLTEMNGKTCD